MSESKVVVKRVIKASPEDVFEAFTNPEIMTKWFYPEDGWTAKVTNMLEVGGSYSITMFSSDGKEYVHVGEYMEITPPEKLVFTWNSDFAQDTVVTVYFRPAGEHTEVTIEHEFLTAEERENHRRGWTMCLGNLEKLFV